MIRFFTPRQAAQQDAVITQPPAKDTFIKAIFDAGYYIGLLDEDLSGEDAFAHFCEIGSTRCLSPSPLFDPAWYLQSKGLPPMSSLEAAELYVRQGVAENADPHPLFSVSRYREQSHLPEGENPVLHYLERSGGQHRALSPHTLFDPGFYLRQNPDIAASGMDPFLHYLRYGWKEGRNPGPYFDVIWYLNHYPQIAAAGIEPLADFIAVGKEAGRRPHHLIDLEYYLENAPDVAAAGVDPLTHYIHYGDKEGRSAHWLFNARFYLTRSGSDASAGALAHYAENGAARGLSPCPAFDPDYYLIHYPDAGGDPLRHYLLSPPGTRRHFHPLIDAAYQKVNSENAATGMDALSDYVRFRSHFDPADVQRGATFIPRPASIRQPVTVPSGCPARLDRDVSVVHTSSAASRPPEAMIWVDMFVQGPVTTEDLHNFTTSLTRGGYGCPSIATVDWQAQPHSLIDKGQAEWLLFANPQSLEGDLVWLRGLISCADRPDIAFVSLMCDGDDEGASDDEQTVATVHAAFTVISRARLQQLGGFSQAYTGIDGAVREASWRASLAGWRNRLIKPPPGTRVRNSQRDALAAAIDTQFFEDTYPLRHEATLCPPGGMAAVV
ncbi:hypothetical protein [Asticcacaulis sp. EMRT-3]|uniref:hypothetical protein n=1 Tax=Asticcacaulis sp. EMRT-3 TaxID=3040349 RepID=UPI0024AF0029|nr:hypothetical protein [Asticcacaulis sp. EMRT-3]MDI7776348.1 hypothetical protein [Asticcacaulis sp. EMRT-3]